MLSPYAARLSASIKFHQYLIQSSGKRGIRKQRAHVSIRVAITLSSVGLVCDLPHSLNVLGGEPNLPSVHILLEILQNFCCLSEDSKLTESSYQTYRKLGSTRDRDNVLSLSQHPRQSDLASGCVVLLADLLQTIREAENVGEVLLGVPRDVSTEVVVFKVIGRFLLKIQWDVLVFLGDG